MLARAARLPESRCLSIVTKLYQSYPISLRRTHLLWPIKCCEQFDLLLLLPPANVTGLARRVNREWCLVLGIVSATDACLPVSTILQVLVLPCVNRSHDY